MKYLIRTELIENKIFLIRGCRVMLDSHLAELYGVTTFNLNKAVSRNLDRFPKDFMLRLTKEEYGSLRFQIGILKRGQHSKYLPHVFTERGVAMLSGVLRSKRAIRANIAIMRAFTRFRHILAEHKELARTLETLEKRISKNEVDIQSVAQVIRDLLEPKEEKPYPRIGFHPPEKERS